MSGVIQYTIRPYDTIWMLAQVFNTTVDSIMDLNPGIEPRNLQVGQVISIMPGYQYYPVQMGPPITNARPEIPGAPIMPGNARPDVPRTPVMPDNARPNAPRTPVMPGNARPGMPDNSGMPGNARPGMPGNSGMPGNFGMPGNVGMPRNSEMPGNLEMPGMNNSMNNMVSEDYVDLLKVMRMLWAEHAIWSHEVIRAMINQSPETDLLVQRLQSNIEDFSSVFFDIYDQEIAQTLQELLSEHISIFADFVLAAVDGDNEVVSATVERLYNNGDQIGTFLGSINPNWSEDEWKSMFSEHIELLIQYVQERINQDYQEAINVFDEILSQALDMADEMADEIYANISTN